MLFCYHPQNGDQNFPFIEIEGVKTGLNQRRTFNLKLEHPKKARKRAVSLLETEFDTALVTLATGSCSEGDFNKKGVLTHLLSKGSFLF